MDTLRSLTAFVHSVELGSLSAAARALDTTQPTVSKLLAALERSLGVRLLQRGTARLALTDEGRRFLDRAQRVLEDYDEAVQDVRAQTQTPRGLLRLSAPRTMGERCVNGMVLEFLAQYPEIELELLLDDRFIDPLEERIDVSLRLGRPLPPNLVARYVGSWPRWLLASPAYAAAHGLPGTPDELAGHSYIRYAAGSDAGLRLRGPDGASLEVAVPSRYRVNSAAAMLDCVQQGLGMSLQPAWMAAELVADGRLVRVLPRHTGPAQEVHLLYARAAPPAAARARAGGLPGRARGEAARGRAPGGPRGWR
jgi:DNA-binding transcriptional LysR family regulator